MSNHIYAYMRTHVHIYMHIYVRMHAHIHTHTNTHAHTHTHEQCPYQNRGCRLYLPNIALACCITQSRGRIWHVEAYLKTYEQSHYHL